MSVQVIAGTVSVTNGSANITFSQAQTIAAGTSLLFSAQAGSTGVVYQLLNAVTAATAATLTFPFTGPTTAAATVTVFRQVIILDAVLVQGGLIQASAVFWLVPSPLRVNPTPGFSSAVPSNSPNPPITQELDLLISGRLIERFDGSCQAQTAVGLEARLAARYAEAQELLTAQGAIGAKLVNAFFDGNAWTLPP